MKIWLQFDISLPICAYECFVCIFSTVDIDWLEYMLNCLFTEDDFLKVFEVPISG